MHPNFPKEPSADSDVSRLSEAWLFAQAILVNPSPRVFGLDVAAGAKREELEPGCQLSLRRTEQIHGEQTAEANTLRDRELLEWAAQISSRAADKLRAIQRTELEEGEASRRSKRFAEILFEDAWDPSKHPRLGGPPNAGWWASSGSGGDTVGADRAVTTASYTDRKRVVAQQASWHPPVGHHWVPVGVTQDPEIRPYLSDEAVQYATGAYSGPTDPHHGNTTLDEVTHYRSIDTVPR